MISTKDDCIKAIITVVVVVVVVACIAVYDSSNRANGRRNCYGTVVKCDGHETEIITDDGLLWLVEDYLCQPQSRCRITFRTQNTDDHTDDEIVSITPETYILPSQIGG